MKESIGGREEEVETEEEVLKPVGTRTEERMS